jgi:hypothetical protein
VVKSELKSICGAITKGPMAVTSFLTVTIRSEKVTISIMRNTTERDENLIWLKD